MIKYKGRVKITWGEIFFLTVTLLLFLGQLIDSNVFFYFYLAANFGLAFCYLFMAQFVLNPDRELNYTISILAGLGMSPVLFYIPFFFTIYHIDLSSLIYLIIPGGLLIALLIWHLIARKGEVRDLYFELILIRYAAVLSLAVLLIVMPSEKFPMKQLRTAFVGQNEELSIQLRKSEAGYKSFNAFQDNDLKVSEMWLDSLITLELEKMAISSKRTYAQFRAQLNRFEHMISELDSPTYKDSYSGEHTLDREFFWGNFSQTYKDLIEVTLVHGSQLLREGKPGEAIELLKRAKFYFKVVYFMEKFDSDQYHQSLFNTFRCHVALGNLNKALIYNARTIREYHRVGWIDIYFHIMAIHERALILKELGRTEESIELMQRIIDYLQFELLDERSAEKLRVIEDLLEKVTEEEGMRVM